MKPAELLDQFVAEARECLEAIGRRLLDVERDPTNSAWLNDLFRHVHTLKGNCGLFDFKPLERVVHAGEDLLDRVRNGSLPYTAQIADALFEAMDFTVELVDAIESEGAIPAEAEARSHALATQLRAQLGAGADAGSLPGAVSAAAAGSATAAGATASAAAPPPAWVRALPAELCRTGRVALRYQPEPECFFKGEDPWHLARSTPDLVFIELLPQAPWPQGDAFDCYRCNLGFVIVSDAAPEVLAEHYRYVPEQVAWHVATAADVAACDGADASAARGPRDMVEPTTAGTDAAAGADLPPALLSLCRQLWRTQCELLARGPGSAGALVAIATTLERLLRAGGAAPAEREALAQLAATRLDAVTLLSWARHHGFGDGSAPSASVPSAVGVSAATAAAPAPAGAPRTAEPREDAATHGAEHGNRLLKVSQDKIDQLMNLIGEMVVAKNALPYLAQRAENVFGSRELAREIKAQYGVINRIAEDMQGAIMQVRMLPVGSVMQRFGRLVRDISKRLGKEVELVIEGEDTEADKNVIESLADPLMHIVRNSLDHGLERPEQRLAAGKPAAGRLTISARQEGDRVLIEIADDGAGINVDRVRAKAVERGLVPAERAAALSDEDAAQLVFLPGFSTAETISDLSGRGVGMDVVRQAVERVGGAVQLSSTRGQGTRIRLSLPLSMAVSHVMVIETAGRRFGVPMELIVETVRVPVDDIHRFKNARTVVLRNRVVPLRALNEMLALAEPPQLNEAAEHAVLVVRLAGDSVGLIVDEFRGAVDIILKPLEGVLAGLTGFAGTALMGDGSVLMVLNPKELA
jgi:two-component system chemotaxis sensor kinase CheA